ncbi:MAG: hypothetical protein ABSG65_06945 [Bryobacteraceae bacterium]|jgi:hypothetical protein
MTIRIPLKWIVLFLFLGIEALILRLFAVSPEKDRAVIAFEGTVVAGAFALFVYMQGVEAQQSRAADKLFERWNNPAMAAYKNIGRDVRRGILDPITLARTSQNVVFALGDQNARGERGEAQKVLQGRDGSDIYKSKVFHRQRTRRG